MPDNAPSLAASDALNRLLALPHGAAALVVGSTDTGKTFWLTEAARALTQAGRSIAVVDCDLGQSEIGPPGTVGAAFVPAGHASFRTLRDLPPLASYFVGATSPVCHGLETAVAACQITRAARKKRPDALLIDTDGWISGPQAIAFKRRLSELLLPYAVFAFARGTELDPLLSAFRGLSAPIVHRVAPASEVQRKSPAVRTARRTARFQAALDGAREVTLYLDNAALLGTQYGTGRPLSRPEQQFVAQSLRVPVLHAERLEGGALYIVAKGERWDTAALGSIEGYFRTSQVTIVPAKRFAGLLCGLIDTGGALLSIGLIRRVDFERQELTLLTPCRRPAAVAQLWLGTLRLRPDGTELAALRPGDL